MEPELLELLAEFTLIGGAMLVPEHATRAGQVSIAKDPKQQIHKSTDSVWPCKFCNAGLA